MEGDTNKHQSIKVQNDRHPQQIQETEEVKDRKSVTLLSRIDAQPIEKVFARLHDRSAVPSVVSHRPNNSELDQGATYPAFNPTPTNSPAMLTKCHSLSSASHPNHPLPPPDCALPAPPATPPALPLASPFVAGESASSVPDDRSSVGTDDARNGSDDGTDAGEAVASGVHTDLDCTSGSGRGEIAPEWRGLATPSRAVALVLTVPPLRTEPEACLGDMLMNIDAASTSSKKVCSSSNASLSSSVRLGILWLLPLLLIRPALARRRSSSEAGPGESDGWRGRRPRRRPQFEETAGNELPSE